jgi:hypothetical protein
MDVVGRIQADGAEAGKASVAGVPVVPAVGRPSDPGAVGVDRIEQARAFLVKRLLDRVLLRFHGLRLLSMGLALRSNEPARTLFLPHGAKDRRWGF